MGVTATFSTTDDGHERLARDDPASNTASAVDVEVPFDVEEHAEGEPLEQPDAGAARRDAQTFVLGALAGPLGRNSKTAD